METPISWGDFFTDRWREFTIPLPVGVEQSDVDIDDVEVHHGGGASIEIGHRILCWRVRGVVLELTETSLDTTLAGNALRFRFPAPVIPKVCHVSTRGTFCLFATTELGTIHRIVFNIDDITEGLSILDSFSYSVLQNPGHHVVLHGTQPDYLTCSAVIDEQRIAMGTSEGSIIIVSLCAIEVARTATNDPVSVDILRHQGTVQRLIGALFTPFKRRATETAVRDINVFICGTHEEHGDIFLVSLCEDHSVRCWSLHQRSLVQTLNVVWDDIEVDEEEKNESNTEKLEHTTVFMRVIPWSRASFGILVALKNGGHCQLQVHRATVPFGSLSMGGSIGDYQVVVELDRIIGGPESDVIDVVWRDQNTWILTRDTDGLVGLRRIPMVLNNDDMECSELSVRVLDNDTVAWLDEFAVGPQADEDPEMFYAAKLFATHRFSIAILRKALGQIFGHSVMSMSLTYSMLRSAACKEVRSEAVRSLSQLPPVDSTLYHSTLCTVWNRVASRVFEIWSDECEPLSLIGDGVVGIVRRGGLSLVRNYSTMGEALLDSKDNVATILSLLSNAVGGIHSILNGVDSVVDPLESALSLLSNPIQPSVTERIRRSVVQLNGSIIDEMEGILDKIDDAPDQEVHCEWGTASCTMSSGPAIAMTADGVAQTLNAKSKLMAQLTLLCVYLVQNRQSTRLTTQDMTKLADTVTPRCSRMTIAAYIAYTLCTHNESTIELVDSSVGLMVTNPRDGSECGAALFNMDTIDGGMVSDSNPTASILTHGLNTLSISRRPMAKAKPHTMKPQLVIAEESSITQVCLASKVHQITQCVEGVGLDSMIQFASAIRCATQLFDLSSSVIPMLTLLSRLGLHGHVQSTVRLLDPIHHSPASTHYLGHALLSTGEASKAYQCIVEVVAGLNNSPELIRMITGTLEDENQISVDSNRIAIRYLIHAMQLFERHVEPDFVLKCALAAIPYCTLTLDSQKTALCTTVFQHHLDLGRFDEAFLAAVSNPDPSLRHDATSRLVSVLCETNQIHKLVSVLPWGEQSTTVSEALTGRARSTRLDHGGRDAYHVLYSWQVYRGMYRQAASTMLELAGCEEYPKRRAVALAAASNALSLVEPKSAWLLRKSESDRIVHNTESTVDDCGVAMTMSVMSDRDGASTLYLPDASRALLSLSPASRAPMEVISTKDLQRGLLLALAQNDLGGNHPNTSLDAQDVLSLLLERGLFNRAADMSELFTIQDSRRMIIQAMAASCTQRVLSGDINVVLWTQLENQLSRWSSDELYLIAYATVISCDSTIAVPGFLKAVCEERCSDQLMMVLLKYGRVGDAVKVACTCIDTANSRIGNRHGSHYLPYTAIDAVLQTSKNSDLDAKIKEYMVDVERFNRAIQ